MATESWGKHRWPHSSMPAPLRELPHAVDVAPEPDRQNIDRVGRVGDAVHHPIGTQVRCSQTLIRAGQLTAKALRVHRQPLGDERVGGPGNRLRQNVLER